MREISSFPFSLSALDKKTRNALQEESVALMKNYKENAVRKECFYKTTGNVSYDEYYPKKAKHIIDKIDTLLAVNYHLNELTLDFIISFDIKFRLGDNDD